MGGSVFTEGDSGVGCGYLDIGLTVAYFLAYLVIDAACHELRKGAGERNLAGDGKTCGHADHIGLGDSALDESLREFIGELVHLEGALEVGREGHYSGILLSGLVESRSEAASGIFLTGICVFHRLSILR